MIVHAWVLGIAVAWIPVQDQVTDAVCLMCHDGVEAAVQEPAGGAGESHVHDDASCVDCHLDLRSFDTEEMEHEVPTAKASCAACHGEVERALQHGAHGQAGTSCADCHGGHVVRAFHDADRALVTGRINALCTRCHSEVIAAAPGEVHASAFQGRSCLACHDAHDAQRPQAPAADRACLMCHEESATGAAPAAAVEHSVHGLAGVSCVLCHADLVGVEQPHDEELALAAVDCAGCHAQAGVAHARGVHGGTGDNGHLAAACTDCHGGHDVRALADPRSRVAPRNLPATCESCHNPTPPAGHPAPAGERVRIYETSIHGRLLLEQGLVVSATCSSCHGSHEIRPGDEPESATSRRHVPYTCGACHAGVLEGYLAGVHGTDFVSGGEDVPVCTDCHSEHAIEDPALESSSVSQALVAGTCAECHADDELAGAHGFESTVRDSWSRSYHGIASRFGETAAANCASCHGFHAILPSTDERSRVHPDNLEETCGSCHPSAGAAFAAVPVHSLIDRESNFVPWIVRGVYAVLVVGVIGAFLLFILVDLFGRLRLRLGWGPRERDPIDPAEWPDEDQLVPQGATFTRMGRQGRVQHGILITSFLLLVITGLPVFLHDNQLMRSLIDLEGGFHLRSLLHRAGALALVGLSVWHLAMIAMSPGGRAWFASMMLRPRDLFDFFGELMFNLGLADWLSRRRLLRPLFARFPRLAFRERPRVGRYGLVEKLEYGAVLWGNLVMIASGAILWRPDWFLRWTPAWTFEVCRVVHGFEATLAFLAIIIWHMYHVHLRPEVFPMSRIWLTGQISRDEMRHHHPREYQRILHERRARVQAQSPMSEQEDPADKVTS